MLKKYKIYNFSKLKDMIYPNSSDLGIEIKFLEVMCLEVWVIISYYFHLCFVWFLIATNFF